MNFYDKIYNVLDNKIIPKDNTNELQNIKLK